MKKVIFPSNDDRYGQILSLNRVHAHSHLFLYVSTPSSKGKNNTTLRHFCYAIMKVGFFITGRVENHRLSLQLYEYDVT